MKINNIKRFIKACLKKDIYMPVLLVGSMGVGKSQIFQQIRDEESIGLVDLRLAQQESGDLIGLPYNKDGRTEWAKPGWFPKEGTRGMIFLDELNRAPTDVRQAVFQLVLDRRIHTHVLPDGWFVYAAVNPDNGNYQVESLDPAMMRRFLALEVTPDVDTWLEWANNGNIDATVTGFINSNRKLLFNNEDIKLDVKPTPDSYRMLNTLLAGKVIEKEDQVEIFRGLIGNEASIALIKYMNESYDKPVSGKDILADYAKVRAKVKKQKNDANHVTIDDLVSVINPMKELAAKDVAFIGDFMVDMPKESQAALISKLPKHLSKQILTDKRISEITLSIMDS